MQHRRCPRQAAHSTQPCGGLSIYQDDPRYMVGYERLRFWHCLNCGDYAFIVQPEPSNVLPDPLWWLQNATVNEARHCNTKLREELDKALGRL